MLEILTGGFTIVAQKMGAGVTALVEGIFLTTPTEGGTQSLSTFGVIIIVFAGVSLSLGLARWVINFCTSLGARNR